MAQARLVADALAERGAEVEIVGITTRGDRVLDRSLASIGGDGVFVKELEGALIDGRADVAVHSMKDLPTELPPELCAGAVLKREDARDVLVSSGNRFASLGALAPGAIVGTSSLRRKAIVAIQRPDAQTRDLRGNVDTRVRKVLDGAYDAAILALAGMKRLGLLDAVGGGSPLAIDEMVPAVGQGAIYAECRSDDEHVRTILAALNHPPTALATAMERALLRRMGGGCAVPIGAYASVSATMWTLQAIVAAVDGSASVRRTVNGPLAGEAEAVRAAEALADDMLAAGGRELIDRSRTVTVTEI